MDESVSVTTEEPVVSVTAETSLNPECDPQSVVPDSDQEPVSVTAIPVGKPMDMIDLIFARYPETPLEIMALLKDRVEKYPIRRVHVITLPPTSFAKGPDKPNWMWRHRVFSTHNGLPALRLKARHPRADIVNQ